MIIILIIIICGTWLAIVRPLLSKYGKLSYGIMPFSQLIKDFTELSEIANKFNDSKAKNVLKFIKAILICLFLCVAYKFHEWGQMR
jgi:hypothetical protein